MSTPSTAFVSSDEHSWLIYDYLELNVWKFYRADDLSGSEGPNRDLGLLFSEARGDIPKEIYFNFISYLDAVFKTFFYS